MTANISVVIPLFNKESSIKKTITSVLDQSYPYFELIVVNDGSTDNSLQEASNFTDPRIRIISQTNKGECAARNRGIYDAKYDLIAFLDADDEWLPGFLEKIVHLRERFPDCKVYATAFRKVTEEPSKFKIKHSPYPPGWEGILEDYYTMLLTYTPFCASSIAVDKAALMQNGCFKEGIKLRGDLDLWVRLSIKVKFAYSSEVLSLYRLDAENRVCEMYQEGDLILGEHLVTLDHYLRIGKMPKHLRLGAKRYLTQSLFDCVSRNLAIGNQPYALRLLVKWHFSRNYLRRWLQLLYFCTKN